MQCARVCYPLPGCYSPLDCFCKLTVSLFAGQWLLSLSFSSLFLSLCARPGLRRCPLNPPSLPGIYYLPDTHPPSLFISPSPRPCISSTASSPSCRLPALSTTKHTTNGPHVLRNRLRRPPRVRHDTTPVTTPTDDVLLRSSRHIPAIPPHLVERIASQDTSTTAYHQTHPRRTPTSIRTQTRISEDRYTRKYGARVVIQISCGNDGGWTTCRATKR